MKNIASQFTKNLVKGVRWTFCRLPEIEQKNRLLLSHIKINPQMISDQYADIWDEAGPHVGKRFLYKSSYLFRDDLDFDAHAFPIRAFEKNDVRPRFFREVFAQGLGLRETTEFHYHMERIQRLGTTRGSCKTEDDVLRYLEGKVRLFEDIRRRGELPSNRAFSGKRHDEIGFLVDAQGNLVKGKSGNNRFSIARMLQLESVPVQIDYIHAGQLSVIRKLKGLTAAAKVNRYLLSLQERYVASGTRAASGAASDTRHGVQVS